MSDGPRHSGNAVDWYTYDVAPDGVTVGRGDVLREVTPFGHVVTWTVESIDDTGLNLSRGATRRKVEHGTVRRAFTDGQLVVGAPP